MRAGSSYSELMAGLGYTDVQKRTAPWCVQETVPFGRGSVMVWGGSCDQGAGHSSEVEHSLMVQWVVGSILHGVDPLSYFSFQPVLHHWCNKGRGMCYPVCGMVHIKEPLLLIVLLIGKSSLCGGSGFPFSYQNGP